MTYRMDSADFGNSSVASAIAHAPAGHLDYEHLTQAQGEVLVDTVIFSPCQEQSPELGGSACQ